ncbi:predicted protein [Nematostella vectensis]|uniref:Uncharacterized protein n=1 Tax=Nematostella vectensis TaxID=45351 RepID=A7RLI9_NEMVE|nr:predicted protein [Nematostella vectensis]|eukprot:XP_001639676.1 predicted protein [Nematostella vectensis]
MNFEELMRHAADNKNNAIRQQQKMGRAHKDNRSPVSSSAVQAFLKKKEEEKKRQQAEAEAARRARIQARLEESTKKPTKKRNPQDNKASCDSDKKTLIKNSREVQEHLPRKIPKKSSTPQQGGKSQEIINSKPDVSQTRKVPNLATNSKLNNKTGSKASDQQSVTPKKPIIECKNSKLKKLPAKPVDFKDLLALAEQNKSGKRKMEAPPMKEGKTKKSVPPEPIKDRSSVSRQSTHGEVIRNNKAQSIRQGVKRNHVEASKNNRPPAPERTKKKQEARMTIQTETISNTLTTCPETSGGPVRGTCRDFARQGLPTSRLSGPPSGMRRYQERQYEDYDDYDDDDDDDFIDDGGDEADVSSYIREIFGYDKRKFKDEDFDDRSMEVSYRQIEKEEARSSKIAKLEDEIEFLKEQAELKKQKAALMKKRKK